MTLTMFDLFLFIIGVIFMTGFHALIQKVTKAKCDHVWTTITDETTKSKAELYGESTGRVPTATNTFQLEELTARKRIIIMSCNKCGKLDKTVEKI